MKKRISEAMLPLIASYICEEIKEYGLKKSEEEIAYLADKKLESYWEEIPGRFGGALKMKAVSSEISIAILGTLISGFGNLL